MTHWQPRYIDRVVREAGWTGEDVTPALAMALASSAGMDHYYSDPTGNVEHRRHGLFALTLSEFSSVPGSDIWSPTDNATAAYHLWANAGGIWGWHPVWWGPAYSGALEVANAVNTVNNATAGPGPTDWRSRMDLAKSVANSLYHRMVR